MDRAELEGILIAISLSIFLGYHGWLLLLHGRSRRRDTEFHDYFAAGKAARAIWAAACSADEKEAILAVQTARNAMTACSYLASVAAVLATAGLTIILDPAKTGQIAMLAANDIILRHFHGEPLASPVVVLGLALGTLYGSFVCFAQSMRLYVHVGFYIRAIPSRFNPSGALTPSYAKSTAVHAGMAYSYGMRLFYLFIVLVMWSIGVTALLLSSVAMTLLLVHMDRMEMLPTEGDAALLTAASREVCDDFDGPNPDWGRPQTAAGTGGGSGDGARRQRTPGCGSYLGQCFKRPQVNGPGGSGQPRLQTLAEGDGAEGGGGAAPGVGEGQLATHTGGAAPSGAGGAGSGTGTRATAPAKAATQGDVELGLPAYRAVLDD